MSTKLLIAFDAAHGGRDPGAVGPSGLLEKEVTLPVAQHAARYARGWADVVQTRRGDHYVSLRERCRIANERGVMAFVSIHCNSAKRRTAKGIETWHFRGSERGLALADEEQDAITAAFPRRPDRGVKGAGFYVLRNTRMPAALCELGFISTEEGEAFLRLEQTQEEMGRAIAEGLREWLLPDGITPAARVTMGADPEPHPVRREVIRLLYRAISLLRKEDH